MRYDVLIVGGSFAGLSAALQVARARRSVLVVDAGRPRNRFARTAHGFLGHDGKTPAQIRDEAIQQLRVYPTVSFTEGEVVEGRGEEGEFIISLADGREDRAARLILATGLVDELPAIPGLVERWGVSVLHCPYCHGYEVQDRELGVLANSPLSTHQGTLISDWGPTTYFTQGIYEPDAESAALMARRGVRIERTPVVEVLGNALELDGVRLADGRIVPLGAIFTAARTRLAGPLAEQLGCVLEEGPLGPYIQVNERKATSVPGVFAAGDAAAAMSNATMAAAAGVMAGVAAHQSLVMAA